MSAVIDVRVVGPSWTDNLLPVIAIVISILTLVWTLWARRQDQARLSIQSTISVPLDTPGPAERLIGIEVTNVGRSGSTVLRNLHLRDGRRGGSLWTPFPKYIAPTYPQTLQPGETTQLLLDPLSVARACAENRISPNKLRVVAKTGHGTTSVRLSKGCRWLVRDVGERATARSGVS